MQQHTTRCANGRICNILQCWGCWPTMLLPFARGLRGPYFTLVPQNIYRLINKLEADGVFILPHPNPLSLHRCSLLKVRKAKWKEESRNKDFTLVCVCVFFFCVSQEAVWFLSNITAGNQAQVQVKIS